MQAQVLEIERSISFASVLKLVHVPLKVPAWSVVTIVVIAGVYGYFSGRQNPVHHYVPYVGYPLVLDTTTGKACYSAPPKPSEEGAPVNDGGETSPTGPAIPLCGK